MELNVGKSYSNLNKSHWQTSNTSESNFRKFYSSRKFYSEHFGIAIDWQNCICKYLSKSIQLMNFNEEWLLKLSILFKLRNHKTSSRTPYINNINKYLLNWYAENDFKKFPGFYRAYLEVLFGGFTYLEVLQPNKHSQRVKNV